VEPIQDDQPIFLGLQEQGGVFQLVAVPGVLLLPDG